MDIRIRPAADMEGRSQQEIVQEALAKRESPRQTVGNYFTRGYEVHILTGGNAVLRSTGSGVPGQTNHANGATVEYRLFVTAGDGRSVSVLGAQEQTDRGSNAIRGIIRVPMDIRIALTGAAPASQALTRPDGSALVGDATDGDTYRFVTGLGLNDVINFSAVRGLLHLNVTAGTATGIRSLFYEVLDGPIPGQCTKELRLNIT